MFEVLEHDVKTEPSCICCHFSKEDKRVQTDATVSVVNINFPCLYLQYFTVQLSYNFFSLLQKHSVRPACMEHAYLLVFAHVTQDIVGLTVAQVSTALSFSKYSCNCSLIHTYIPTYLPTYIHTYIHAYMHECMHKCLLACMHTYLNICL